MAARGFTVRLPLASDTLVSSDRRRPNVVTTSRDRDRELSGRTKKRSKRRTRRMRWGLGGGGGRVGGARMLLMTNGEGSACTALAQGSFSFHFSPHVSVSSSRLENTLPELFPARRERERESGFFSFFLVVKKKKKQLPMI